MYPDACGGILLSLFTPNLDLSGMSCIDVLRGPQGTPFGSGSLSGTMRDITNPPALGATEGAAELGFSSPRRWAGQQHQVHGKRGVGHRGGEVSADHAAVPRASPTTTSLLRRPLAVYRSNDDETQRRPSVSGRRQRRAGHAAFRCPAERAVAS